MQAIETRYKGYRFRSRLEARWAVVFDTLGLRWEYEKEGYEFQTNPPLRYLPDFWIPWRDGTGGDWLEIKGTNPDARALLCAEALVRTQAGTRLTFLIGDPGNANGQVLVADTCFGDEIFRGPTSEDPWGPFCETLLYYAGNQGVYCCSDDVVPALLAGRGARFEFGERAAA